MRRSNRPRPVPYKSPRLFSMVALLVCLLLMMNSLNNMRGPGPLAQKIISNLDESIKLVGTENPQPKTKGPESQEPQVEEFQPEDSNAAGIQSLNLREDLELQDWLGLAQDGALKMQKLEMPAYWRIMSVVKNASFSDLQKAAESKIRFNDLYSSPGNHRSKLITLTVNVRKINRYETEENAAGVQELFEVWGWSETSKAWLYVFVTPELPHGLDANTPVNQSAKFAGYFFKLQGYQPGVAKPNANPLRAPLLIGKFELSKPVQRVAAQAPATIEWIFGSIILIVGLVVILLRIFVFSAKKPKLSRIVPSMNLDIFPPAPLESADKSNH